MLRNSSPSRVIIGTMRIAPGDSITTLEEFTEDQVADLKRMVRNGILTDTSGVFGSGAPVKAQVEAPVVEAKEPVEASEPAEDLEAVEEPDKKHRKSGKKSA